MGTLKTNSVGKTSGVPPTQTENIHQLLPRLEAPSYAIAKAILGQILDHPDSQFHLPKIVAFFKSPKEYFIQTPNYARTSDMRSELFDEISKRCSSNLIARAAAMRIFKHLYNENYYFLNGNRNNEHYFFLLAFTCVKDINADENLKDELTREGIDFPKVLEYLVTKGYAKLVFVDR